MLGAVWQTIVNCSNIVTQNITTASLVVLLVTILFVFVLNTRGNGGKSRLPRPPGPWGLPIVGHLPFLGKNPVHAIREYRKDYGDIFSIRMGSHPVVVLNGSNVIRQALTNHHDDFAGRPQLFINTLISKKNQRSLTFSKYSPAWKVQRRISNNALRMFGSYKNNPVEEIIHGESSRLVDYILSQSGRPIDLQNETALAASSVIYQILFGRHSNIREDENYLKAIQNIKDFFEFAKAGKLVDFMPWTRFIFRKTLKRFVEILSTSREGCQKQIERHLETFDPNDLRDVSDAVILAAKEITPEEQRLGLSTEGVLSVINDFMGAGSETVATTLLWSFLYMATHPEIQTRVHAEIDKHIGVSRLPTYEDKQSMPYVEATILEVLRKGTIVPLGIPHATTRDVEFMGYSIPNDTFVLVNLSSTCDDPTVWGDPGVFRPERFITDQGIDSTKAEMVLTFGAGRRRCVGEFLAKVELFVFFTSILQRCAFKTLPGELYDFKAVFGLTLKPSPFKLIVESRSV